MKKFLAFFLAMIMLFTISPPLAFAVAPTDYNLLYTNGNIDAVSNDPKYEVVLEIENDTLIQCISTYHWNNGKGEAPGLIGIYEFDNGITGELVGSWAANGRVGYLGVPNAYWDVYPNVVLKAGTYLFADSSYETWSWNEGSKGKGFIEVRGHGVKSDSTGYVSSDWAKTELAEAEKSGLIPSILANADLRQPINRGEFAAVCVKTYENLTKTTVPNATYDPFYDTDDKEILKAYQLGITNGTTASAFSPNDLLTREQAATMLTRTYKKVVMEGWSLATDGNYKLDFIQPAKFADDQKISNYARESVYFMAKNNIIKGMGGNKFAPQNTTSQEISSKYANATREQAIIIANRMGKNLSTTPIDKPVIGGEAQLGKAVSATGQVKAGDVSINFGSAGKGTIAIAENAKATEEDSITKGYSIKLSEMPTGPVTLSLDVSGTAETSSDRAQFILIGMDYIDQDGTKGTVYDAVEGKLSGGILTAKIDFKAYKTYVSDIMLADGGKYQPADTNTIAFGIYGANRAVVYNTNGHFRFLIPPKTLKKFENADAKRLLTDMETIYGTYINTYGYNKVTRTEWPLDVFFADQEDDGYYAPSFFYGINGGAMYLQQSSFEYGYKKKSKPDTFDRENYKTVAHELFHFIQNNYLSSNWSATWFDEATAVYYEKVYEPTSTPMLFSENAQLMYDGIVPSSTAGILNFWANQNNGYGRAAFANYLEKTKSGTIKACYTSGGTAMQSGWESVIEKASGKKLSELVYPFYKTYVTEEKTILQGYSNPYNIYQSFDKKPYNEFTSDLSFDATNYGKATAPLDIPRYGARFVRVNAQHLPANGNLTFSVSNSSGKIVTTTQFCVMELCNDKYTGMKVYESKDGKLTIPNTIKDILVMVTNNTNTSLSGNLTVFAGKLDGFAVDDSLINKMHTLYKGTYISAADRATEKSASVNVSQANPTDPTYISVDTGTGYRITGRYDQTTGLMRSDEVLNSATGKEMTGLYASVWITSDGQSNWAGIGGYYLKLFLYTEEGVKVAEFHCASGGIDADDLIQIKI